MKKNPFGIIRTFDIPYNDGRYELEGRIRAHTEEGFDDVTWFDGEIVYPTYGKFGREIGGMQLDELYQAMRRGAPTETEVEQQIRAWCKSFGLTISANREETIGVTRLPEETSEHADLPALPTLAS